MKHEDPPRKMYVHNRFPEMPYKVPRGEGYDSGGLRLIAIDSISPCSGIPFLGVANEEVDCHNAVDKALHGGDSMRVPSLSGSGR